MAYTRPNLTQEEVQEIVVLYHLGIKMPAIAHEYNISTPAVAYHVRPYKLVPVRTDLRRLAKTILANELQHSIKYAA